MKKYQLYNNIFGWFVFLIAITTYILTIEPTTSFWDCGEFITSSYKLEVGHPPGAPVFMLLGNLFSNFASDPSQVAYMINVMSALMSAFTILFLFWTITHIARRIIHKKDETLSLEQTIAILGSGMVGALAYTFSDTFWFSATEAEVYASSSFFTAIVFWAILKWEDVADEPYANRWIIFIAYLMGLSIGVHLLNLLAVPAIVLVYYFRRYTISRNGILAALAIGVVSLAIIMYGIIQGLIMVAAKFELIFTNSFGLPFNTGTIFYLILISSLIVGGIYYAYEKRKILLHTILSGIAVILIGYSSFALIMVRSMANPPMDQNDPENIFDLLSYLNREQYGDRPLVTGEYFNSDVVAYDNGKLIYTKKNDRYEVADERIKYIFDPTQTTVFPRMYSSQQNHPDGYKKWANLSNVEKTPSFAQNLAYFFKYQVNFMYLRYFMWNFAGRQNDIQGHGNILHGNWISGISFIDEWRLGPQENLPDHLANNKGRNKYYFLPLLLGLLGILFMSRYNSNSQQFLAIVSLFFIFTGLAIVVYLNQPPFQPRERDYAYAGSFYVFTMFIGLGVLQLYEWMKKIAPSSVSAIVATLVSLVFVPSLLANQNWDDHDRSGRYTARDIAHNYLNSCAPNAILFTNGDNDTFPLWYAQEVEGIRTDIKIINLSYFNTDWYVNQTRRYTYDALPVVYKYTPEQYMTGQREIIKIEKKLDKYVPLRQVLNHIGSNDSRTIDPRSGYHIMPTAKLLLAVDSAKVIANGIVKPKDASKIEKNIRWEINKKHIRKNELMFLDLLDANDWNRPIYFATTVGQDNYMSLENYFQLEGMAYKLVPIYTKSDYGATGHIDSDILYDRLMNTFQWGGIENEIYLDENNTRMLTNTKNTFTRLAETLNKEGRHDKAIEVLDKIVNLLPNEKITYGYFDLLIAQEYYTAGAFEKGNSILKILSQVMIDDLDYYLTLPTEYKSSIAEGDKRAIAISQQILGLLNSYKQTEMLEEIQKDFDQAFAKYE